MVQYSVVRPERRYRGNDRNLCPCLATKISLPGLFTNVNAGSRAKALFFVCCIWWIDYYRRRFVPTDSCLLSSIATLCCSHWLLHRVLVTAVCTELLLLAILHSCSVAFRDSATFCVTCGRERFCFPFGRLHLAKFDENNNKHSFRFVLLCSVFSCSYSFKSFETNSDILMNTSVKL